MSEPKVEGRQLKAFEIRGLHGDRNVRLELNRPIKILVDANGSGKTTVLSTLFHLLTGKLHRLVRLKFDEISTEFDTGEKVTITAGQVSQTSVVDAQTSLVGLLETNLEGTRTASFMDRVMAVLGPARTERLLELARQNPPHMLVRFGLVNEVGSALGVPRVEVARRLASSIEKVASSVSASLLQKLHTLYPYQVLYFPTYRRIEEDLHTLGYPEPDLPKDEQLIQFGMGDVQQRLERITTQIRDSSIEWYSKINGRILTELIDGIQVTPEMRSSLQDAEALRIVLDRVGENIDEEHKRHILELIRTGRIQENQYSPLVYFLSNLGKVYEQQRDKDNMIKEFARVANSYLADKEVLYNESKLQISIIHKRSGRRVDVERLSSGEKQIVSIFSRLYLSPHREYVLLFDEPELSLSIEWQKRLLEDIVASRRCKLLIAATHSPFVFDNSLDSYAGELVVTPALTGLGSEIETEGAESNVEDAEE